MSQLPGVNTNIAGPMPFSAGGAGMIAAGAGGSPVGQQLGQQYADAYSTALQQNQANYSNILSGYQQTAANQQTQQQAIAGGYTGLAGQIGQNLQQQQQGVGQNYNALQGGITQNLGTSGGQALQGLAGAQQNIMGGYNALGGQVQGALGGMDTALQAQAAQSGNIQAGYGQLQNSVLGGIQGIGQSQAQAIQDAYAQQQGGLTQQLLNSGLGNTTVMGSMQRGTMLDKQKADIALANQIAQLQAGYQSQLGQAGLNFANQANMQNTAQANLISQNRAQYGAQIGEASLGYQNQAAQQQLAQRNLTAQQQAAYGSQIGLAGLGYQGQAAMQQAQMGAQLGLAGLGASQQMSEAQRAQANQQLGFMNTVSAQYPDAAQYGNLLQQYGQFDQMNQNRAQQQSQFGQMLSAAQMARAQGQGGRQGGVLGTESGAGLPGQNQLTATGQPSGVAPPGGPGSWSIPQNQLQLQQLQQQLLGQASMAPGLGGQNQYGNLLGQYGMGAAGGAMGNVVGPNGMQLNPADIGSAADLGLESWPGSSSPDLGMFGY